MEPEPDASPPRPARFQFSLRALFLLFVVLAASLAHFGTGGIVVVVPVVWLAIYLNQGRSLWSPTRVILAAFTVMCLFELLLFVVLSAVSAAREAERLGGCPAYLKQIALALQNYHQANGCFPPAYVADKNGKPMHSWRVLILPYLECDSLYRAYDFSEPWDGPNNRRLLAMRPTLYVCPGDPKANSPDTVETSYLAVVGPNTAWPGAKSWKLAAASSRGEQSGTILLVESADSGIAWTEPRDLSLETLGAAGAGAPAVSNAHGRREGFYFTSDSRGACVAMADGSVGYVPAGNLSTEELRKILQVGAFYREKDPIPDEAYRDEVRLNWPNIAALAVWFLAVGVLLIHAVRNRQMPLAP
ncbi:MAG: DUF1559 family PulG-like putative transporter [Pirellulales bacterium]